MYTKAKKTISHVTPESPMTNEEKQARIMQFLTQKRETFSLSILNGLCHNIKSNTPEVGVIEGVNDVVDLAVSLADKLMEKLYPMPKEDEE